MGGSIPARAGKGQSQAGEAGVCQGGPRPGPPLRHRTTHFVDRDISDMIRRLDRYTTARALDLRDSGDIGSAFHKYRGIASRFWKCFVGCPATSAYTWGG